MGIEPTRNCRIPNSKIVAEFLDIVLHIAIVQSLLLSYNPQLIVYRHSGRGCTISALAMFVADFENGARRLE